MRVKILKVPGQSTLPENRVNPFSVPDEFKYGGNLPNQKFGNRQIDTFSDFLRQPMKGTTYQQSPYANTGKQLPEVPEGTPDAIKVEKEERVVGDFNGDGMPVLMGTNVGSHDSGNDLTTIVPSGSFVFSDTPSLKIKDPQILEMFGKKKPMTPAQIAKQYDLQSYKKILDDKERGEVDKNTARLMYGNCTNKLNMLASVQEEMKMKQDEKKMMKMGGYATGGPTYPYYGYNSIAENQKDMIQQNPKAAWFVDNIMGIPATGTWADDKNGRRTRFLNSIKNESDSTNLPDDNIGYSSPDVTITGNRKIHIDPLPMTGMNHSAVPENMNQIDIPGISFTKSGKKGKIGSSNKKGTYDGRYSLNPDALAALTAGMRVGQYPDYNPIKQIAHGAIPQAVYMDPTRAKAAIQEGVNSATNSIAMGANGPIARANILALQGKAGSEAANVEAQYAQQNAQIANRTNEQAAQLYNQLWKDQQTYNKEYVEETHNAQMDKLGYQASTQNELLKQAYLAENRKRTAYNFNFVNPYYTMDSRGYMYAKSPENAVHAIGNGSPSGNSSGKEIEAYMTLYKQAIAKGMDPKRADIWAAGQSGMLQRSSTSYESNNPMSQKVRTSNNYDENKRGGPIKKSKVRIVDLP